MQGFHRQEKQGYAFISSFTLCTKKREPHLAEDRRATSWLDRTFRCTAFVTNHTLDPLLCMLDVTDVGWWESLRDCCSRRCCCGGRGGKRCHASCFLRLHATSHFEVRQLKGVVLSFSSRCCATLCFLAYPGTFQSTKHGGENGEHPDD